jgi:hypothetical protein
MSCGSSALAQWLDFPTSLDVSAGLVQLSVRVSLVVVVAPSPITTSQQK